jgi:CRP-like cAMP-binding protein
LVNKKSFAAGEVIFRPGDPSEFAYIIKSGQVEILKGFPDSPVRLALLGPAQIFGEMGLVDERPRSLAARAVTEVRLKAVTRDEFATLIIKRPKESLKYLKTLFERLRAMNTRVAGELIPETAGQAETRLSVMLVPLTSKAGQVVPQEGLTLTVFPFRIGRASQELTGYDPMEINDLILPDESPYYVSKNHLSIDVEQGRAIIRDRGSYLGTVVNGLSLGGHHRGASAVLREGDNEVIIGSTHSPFRFRLTVRTLS